MKPCIIMNTLGFKLITNPPVIRFQNVTLKYMDAVKHLSHILHYKLNDGPDIVRAIKDLNKKANSMLYTFRSADPVVKTFLIKMYCLSLYGCHTWSLSSKCLFHIQVAMNKILRKVWNLPHRSHTSIVHCTADIPAICNLVYSCSCKFLSRSLLSYAPIVSSIIHESSSLVYDTTTYMVVITLNFTVIMISIYRSLLGQLDYTMD